jgi:hypothetical protein
MKKNDLVGANTRCSVVVESPEESSADCRDVPVCGSQIFSDFFPRSTTWVSTAFAVELAKK